MANLTVRLHADEAAAVRYALLHQAEERSWAVIVFNALTPHRLNYSIRLNYSTIPNTYFITNEIARAIDTQYEQYYLSGFLTLQVRRRRRRRQCAAVRVHERFARSGVMQILGCAAFLHSHASFGAA